MHCHSVRMTAVEDVLRRHGYSMSEQALAAQLDALFSLSDQGSVGIDMSFADAAYLARYSGVADASDAISTRHRPENIAPSESATPPSIWSPRSLSASRPSQR